MTVTSRLLQAVRSSVSSPSLSRSTALAMTERLSAATHLVASLEFLTTEKDHGPGGVNNWEVSRANFATAPATVRRLLDAAADRRTRRMLHLARAGAAAALLAPLPRRGRLAANAVVAGTSLLLYPGHLYGTDGSDQVSFLVQTVTTVARAGERNPRVVDACLWFVAGQSVLSYAVSGWVKLAGPTWRSGQALPGIMRTESYGDRTTWELIRRFPRTARAVAAGVLVLECAFPLVYVARGRPARLMVGSAAAFHLANARVMGLGRFVWSFASMYPAVLYTAGLPQLSGADTEAHPRHDTLPVVAAGLLGAGWAAAGIAAARNRRAVLRGRGDELMVTTSAGNTLAYRWTAPPSGAGTTGEPRPVVILENGLGSSEAHWEHIVQALSARHHVVTYQRAGYGRSTYRGQPQDFDLDAAVEDLVDLVKQTAGDRPVVLVGHSLGGYLVTRAAERLPGHIAGVCLVDSSHPDELRRSPRQAQGGSHLTSFFGQVSVSLALGLGVLLKEPDWARQLPGRARSQAIAEYRDRRLWTAARREWRATQEHFDSFDGTLPRMDVPLLVLTADRTAVQDPELRRMHAELAERSPRSRHTVLEDSDHNGLLSGENQAGRVAMLLDAFITDLARPSHEESDDDHPGN
ncbi:alpha/beta fold hydrolase [Kitasatospora sp. DSM 101779]|uniref:alpha/beta fold hydrolase n=1 Tax=Kitasatospora sp. DSM 101779 TaxID=2853165 RepID=UPI0021D8B31E|nr:alpha/beta fold hydrolase [Kitasatospora sp. DSM 101779]MCU7820141.1 alpha/beta fold hydrolase [Kitasatospora sp. DSM 101779]